MTLTGLFLVPRSITHIYFLQTSHVSYFISFLTKEKKKYVPESQANHAPKASLIGTGMFFSCNSRMSWIICPYSGLTTQQASVEGCHTTICSVLNLIYIKTTFPFSHMLILKLVVIKKNQMEHENEQCQQFPENSVNCIFFFLSIYTLLHIWFNCRQRSRSWELPGTASRTAAPFAPRAGCRWPLRTETSTRPQLPPHF